MQSKLPMLFFVLLISIQQHAQITISDVDNIVFDEMVRQELPGLAIGVYKKGAIDFLKGYGHIDINRTKAITTSTPFRWASISKTITAVAALQLVERRTDFSINDKVTKHYPYWISNVGTKEVSDKSRKSNITIKQLLTHRSGINHYDDKEGVDYRKSTYTSDADRFNANSCVDVFRDMNLLFNPGDKYDYSTYGYNLLGAVIDKVTGSYPNWVLNSIANKLSMTSLKVSYGTFSGFDKPTDGIMKANSSTNKEYVLPGGGWESNVGDLMKFAKGILDGKLLNNTAALWADDGFKETNGDPQEYKRGIYSAKGTNDFRVWHGGAHENLRTNMYIMPDLNIAVVVMIPADYADAFNVVRKVIDKMGINRSFDTKPDFSCTDGTGSSGKSYLSLIRKTGEDVIVRRGYSSDNFNKEWNFLKSRGYELTDFDCTDNLWNGIFKKMSGQFAMWRNLEQDAFNTKWQEMNNAGLRLYDLETYVISGKRYWAGLFKKGTGKYALFRNFSTADFGTKRDELANQGYKLIDIEVYSDASGLKWSGVWVEGTDGPLNRNYAYNDFISLVNTRSSSGYQLLDVETYMDGSTRKWAGVWEKATQSGDLITPRNYCQTMNLYNDNSKKDYELLELVSY
jgi:CubicO group peptidase (beta-lactamase class C family)